MRKSLRMIIAALAAAVCFTGCGDSASVSKTGQNSGNAPEKVSIILDWYPNAVHSFLYTAMDRGYFKEEGIEPEILFPSGTADAITMTAAGRADLGIYYPTDLLRARVKENIPVRSIASLCSKPLDAVISRKEKNITRPRDLTGKRVGTAGDEREKIMRYIIDQDGGDSSTVEFIDVGFDLLSAITTDQVDATMGNMVNHEVPALQKQGIDINYFLPSDFGGVNYPELIMIAGEDTLSKRGDTIRRFLKACRRGFEEVKKNPEEGLDILFRHEEKAQYPLDRDVEKTGWKLLEGVMETEDHPFLSQSEEMWRNFIAFNKKIGFIDHEIEPSEIFTTDYFPTDR